MDYRIILELILALLAMVAGGGYVATEARRRKEQADARQSEWGVYKDQLLTAWGEMKELRERIEGLESRQDEYAAHIDDLYGSIRQEQDGGQAILGRLTTQRPGARIKLKIKKEVEISTQPATA